MKIYFKIALSLLLFSICTSCEKDKLSEEPDSTVEQTHQQNHTITITIGDAKRAFETDMNNTDRTDENLASPAWEAAINSRYADALDIVITPLDPAEVASDVPGALINVVSYTNDAQETDYYYLVSIPDTDYFIENNYNAEVANFTGVFAAIHKDGTLYDPLIIRGGVPDEVISTTAFEEELACWPPSWWPWGGGVDCPGYGGNFSWAELILTIRMFFSTDTGGPGSTSTPPDNSLTFLSYIWNLNISDWTTTNTGTPEGGGGVLFNEDLLSGEDRIIASEINTLKTQLNLWQSSEQILHQINQSCASVEDFATYLVTDEFGYPALNALFYKIHLHAQTACVAEVIIQDRIYAMEEMGITITEEQLTDIVGEDCVYGPDFAECSLGATIEWISEELGLTQDQKNCLQNNALIVPQITDYLLNNNSESIATFLNNYSAEDNPCPTINALSNFLALKQQNDNYKVDRFIELYTLLEEDPEALVENCITEEDLSFWVDLLTFQIPQVCEDKIDALGNGWANQPLEDGDGTTVNLDYYSITIDQLPTRPNGSSFEGIDEFFQYFRLNFYDFIDQNISHFQFFPEPFNDEDLWSSTSPLTSIFTIDISAGPASDDGAVICSSIDGCCWVFSTIKTPQWGLNGNNDGFHPVSGNRQFGYITNGDTYTIYTKGADRANKHDWLNLFSFIFDEEQEIYNGGHNCWVSLMESIENYTQSNGGVVASVYNNDGNLKPKWEIIKNLLQGIEPITVIPCN